MKKVPAILTIAIAASIFMGQTHEAHAILGIRAARTALAARKAKQALAEDPNAEATKKTNEDLQRLKEENGRSAAQPPSYGKTRF